MYDIFDKIADRMKRDLGQFSAIGHGYYSFPKLEGEIGPRMRWRGKEVIVWSVNNYLGLANHPEVRKVDAEAAAKWGLAYPMGARMMTGHTDLHEAFEREIANFMEYEAAILLNYGFQGMVSLIPALTDRRDVIIYDELAHACIIDGMALSPAKRFVYPHNDIEKLERHLQRAMKIVEETKGGILVISEGVFGMRGDLGALDQIVALKEKYPFRFLVDDAHGFGVMGANGRGTPEHFGVHGQDKVDLYFGTFAKSLAGIGAFVLAEKKVIQYLYYHLRSQIFAKSLPSPMVEGGLKRLELLRTRPELRQRLWHIVHRLQNGLRERGFDTGNTQSPVTPVFLKASYPEAMNLIFDLRENYHVFVSGVVYPVVPRGELLLRLIPTAVHTDEDVDTTLQAFESVRPKLLNGEYNREPYVFSIVGKS